MRNASLFVLLAFTLTGCPQGVTPDAATEAATPDAVTTDVQNATDATDTIVAMDVPAADVPATEDVPPAIDVAPPIDVIPPDDGGPAPDALPPGDGGTCMFGGIYSVTFMGTTVYFRFSADGQWAGATTPTGFDAPDAAGGTWALSGTRVTIHDSATSSGGGCPPEQEGAYDATFAADCTVTLTLVSDPCDARGTFLGGATFTPYTP